MAKKKKWIQEAIQRPGALTAKAKKEGAMTKQGKISSDWLDKMAGEGGRTGKQARLAKTLRKFH